METPNYQLSLNLGKDLQNTVPSKTEPVEREHCSPQIPSRNMPLFVHSSAKPLEKEECCWGCRGCRNPQLARASHPGPSNAHGQGHGEQPVQEAPLEVGTRDSWSNHSTLPSPALTITCHSCSQAAAGKAIKTTATVSKRWPCLWAPGTHLCICTAQYFLSSSFQPLVPGGCICTFRCLFNTSSESWNFFF